MYLQPDICDISEKQTFDVKINICTEADIHMYGQILTCHVSKHAFQYSINLLH